MAHAYTPGLELSEHKRIERVRRLPIAGEVLVSAGARVTAGEPVARAELPGAVLPFNVAGLLGVDPGDVPPLMLVREGDHVPAGASLARSEGFFGWFRATAASPVDAVVESISRVTGQVMLRERPRPVTVSAYLDGEVARVLPGEGVVVRAVGAFVQGIFGLGGEAVGPLRVLGDSPADRVGPGRLDAACRGAVLVCGGHLSHETFEAARAVGAAAVVCGGFAYEDVRRVLGRDVGVAVTGTEALGTTLVVTEGFGPLAMAAATWSLLSRHAGARASVNGATQIRAGVIRPEVVIPFDGATSKHALRDEARAEADAGVLELGSAVRCIRVPYFGRLGRVSALPVEPEALETESAARVLEVTFDDGTRARVPRANVERIAGV